ncbi:hypothetical protein PCHDK_000501700, partial [Plasmodium chabaudi adami]
LKGLYDDFRSHAIKNTDSSNDLANKLQKLTLKNGVELNATKGLYDDFRSHAIKNTDSSNDLANKLQKLTLKNGVELNATKGYISYNFSNSKCKFLHKKKPTIHKASKSNPKPASPSPQEPQRKTQQLSSTTTPEEPPAKLELPSSSLQESQKPGKIDQNEPK